MESPAPSALKHPSGLYTLFFTEMWERFSFYGMRGLLVLFLVDNTRGGFGLSDEVATAIYGLYAAAVYLSALPGGWLSDRILGAQRAVWFGGIIIACGHFTIALDRPTAFYLGLILIVAGTGLLKPNISAMVGELYPEGGARRDAGFTIFYMGINLGAALGPVVCALLAKNAGWPYGFGAAGVGMIIGLIQFRFTRRHLGAVGVRPSSPKSPRIPIVVGVLFAIVLSLCFAGVIRINPIQMAQRSRDALVAIALVYFAAVFIGGKLTTDEKKRVGLIVILFIAAALFWSGFEQMGSSFNLFADRFTERRFLGREIPPATFQSVGPIFIILLSPVMAALWIWFAARKINPTVPVKFGFGLVFLSFGFLLMSLAAKVAGRVGSVAPWWLIGTYFLHTIGELCLSPVGLSSITKLAPQRMVGQMMGVWFLAASLGNLLAGLIAGSLKMSVAAELYSGFLQIAILPGIAGLLLIVLARPIARALAEAR